jgi:hypothetical protein
MPFLHAFDNTHFWSGTHNPRDPIGMILSHFVVFGGGLDFGHLDNI